LFDGRYGKYFRSFRDTRGARDGRTTSVVHPWTGRGNGPRGPWTGPFEPTPRSNGARPAACLFRRRERSGADGINTVGGSRSRDSTGRDVAMDDYYGYYDYCVDFADGRWEVTGGVDETWNAHAPVPEESIAALHSGHYEDDRDDDDFLPSVAGQQGTHIRTYFYSRYTERIRRFSKTSVALRVYRNHIKVYYSTWTRKRIDRRNFTQYVVYSLRVHGIRGTKLIEIPAKVPPRTIYDRRSISRKTRFDESPSFSGRLLKRLIKNDTFRGFLNVSRGCVRPSYFVREEFPKLFGIVSRKYEPFR